MSIKLAFACILSTIRRFNTSDIGLLLHIRIILFSTIVFAGATLPGCQPSIRYASVESGITNVHSVSSIPVLQSRIDSLLLPELFPPATAGIKIVSLETGESLYELNPRNLFTPASNQKLLTSATALKILGGHFEFATSAGIDTSDTATICVVGHGDPLIKTSDLDSLASVFARTLPSGRRWTILGDTSFFDDAYWGKGWMWDDEPDPTIPYISSLSVNGNSVTVHVSPGDSAFLPLTATIDPPTTIARIGESGTTVADSVRDPLSFTRHWKEGANVIDISGEMRVHDSQKIETISIANPGLYFVDLLAARLRFNAVDIGTTGLRRAPPAMQELASISHSLDSVIVRMNKESDNLSAECIVKCMAAFSGETPARFETGIRFMKRTLQSMGVDTTNMVLADGSGVSRYNLLSPETIVSVLNAMYRDSVLFPLYYSSLPVAGKDGTLTNRMATGPATNNLRAKTGTVSGVSAFSGYVRSADGEMLGFSIMMQGIPGKVRPYRRIQDSLGNVLAGFSRKE